MANSPVRINIPCQAPGCKTTYPNTSSSVWYVCEKCGYRVCQGHGCGSCPQCVYGHMKFLTTSWVNR